VPLLKQAAAREVPARFIGLYIDTGSDNSSPLPEGIIAIVKQSRDESQP